MRVTHVITRLIVGGAQENTIATLLGLQAIPGVHADLITGIETGAEGSLASRLEPPSLYLLPELVRNINPWKDAIAWRKLTRRFRAQKPQIVHTHSGKAGILGRLAAHKAGVPVIIHTIHGPSFGPFQNAFANQVFLMAERRTGHMTTHFISVADAMSKQYLSAGIGRAGQYTRIFSGFNLEPYLTCRNDPALRQKLGISSDAIVIGKVARLFRLKGHDDLLEIAPTVLKQNPRIKFLLVGDGPERMRLEQRIRNLGLEKQFVFTGLIPPEEIARYTGIMDLLVHLSRREGLARALPQALAAGRPVVAYDCDGAPEVCINDKTGFLIPAGNLVELGQKLILLANDPTLRARLGSQGRDYVKERFDVVFMVEAIYRLYQKLLLNAGSPSRVIAA